MLFGDNITDIFLIRLCENAIFRMAIVNVLPVE